MSHHFRSQVGPTLTTASLFGESINVVAVEGDVHVEIVDGPDVIVAYLTPDAAEEHARQVLAAVAAARAQARHDVCAVDVGMHVSGGVR